MAAPTIDRAVLSDLPSLNRIAFESKAYWDYPAEWMDAWRDSLSLHPADLEAWVVFVARQGDDPRAFAAVDVRADPPMLEHLWVHPHTMGEGLGRRLFDATRAAVREAGKSTMVTDADPHAVGFYERMGGVHVADTPAPVLGTERTLPRMAFTF